VTDAGGPPVFSGSVAAIYQQYMVPMLFAPYAQVVAQRLAGIAVPARLLETAAGTGVVTRELAAISDQLSIVATDLSPAMLEVAKVQVPARNVEWLPADASALPFADATFDAVVCQFGVMFLPDKPKAFGEARRVLREGGRFVFTVWDRLEVNDVTHIVVEAVRDMFPDNPPDFFNRIPHGYSERANIEADLRGGGFREIGFETVELVSPAKSAADAALALCAGSPMRNELEARAPGRLTDVIEHATARLRERYGDGPISAPMRAHLVESRR
jgi:SAM-dependent methyltransferase